MPKARQFGPPTDILLVFLLCDFPMQNAKNVHALANFDTSSPLQDFSNGSKVGEATPPIPISASSVLCGLSRPNQCSVPSINKKEPKMAFMAFI